MLKYSIDGQCIIRLHTEIIVADVRSSKLDGVIIQLANINGNIYAIEYSIGDTAIATTGVT